MPDTNMERVEQYLSRKKKAAKGDEADLYQRFEQLYSKKYLHFAFQFVS